MFGSKARQEKRAEAQAVQVATRNTIDDAVQELLASGNRRTLYVGDRTVAGNRERVSVELQLEYSPGFAVVDAMSFERRYSDFTIGLDVRGTRTVPPFAQRMGLDYSRSYASDYQDICERFASADEFQDWLESPENQDVSVERAWIDLVPK